MLDDIRRDSRNRIVQRGCCASMMTCEHDQDDRLVIHPQYSGVIGNERLSVAGFVRDSYIFQIARESIVNLLLLHDAQNEIAGTLGNQFSSAAREHPGESAFRIISVGADGFRARAQMIDAAQRTLDLQYYIFRGDETGRMLTEHLLRAAERGVRIRVLIDDGDTVAGDEQILRLLSQHSVELRIFNPARYRGHVRFVRRLEFVLNAGRLDYRMHNKLLVADNAVALIGGRNIGNQYFQIDPESQFTSSVKYAGIEGTSLPSSRSFGINANFKFKK